MDGEGGVMSDMRDDEWLGVRNENVYQNKAPQTSSKQCVAFATSRPIDRLTPRKEAERT